jgi:hypothetical protein
VLRLIAIAGGLAALAGCRSGPKGAKSAEEAFRATERATVAGDLPALYAAVTDKTRFAIQGAHKDLRLCRSLIEGKFPHDAAATRLSSDLRLAAAASEDVVPFFARRAKDLSTIDRLRGRVGSVSGPVMQKPDGDKGIWVARQDGKPFHMAQNQDGTWGSQDLLDEWMLEQDRAAKEVKLVREEIEKAGAR